MPKVGQPTKSSSPPTKTAALPNGKQKQTKAPLKPSAKATDSPPILYPTVQLQVATIDQAAAKQLLYWQTEEDASKEAGKKVTFGTEYLLTDLYGNKVRCLANLKNRPYYSQVTNDWMLEILRGKWQLNGETIIVDEYGGVQSGQHRLVGLVLANQAWELDAKLEPATERRWAKYWPTPPSIQTALALGIKGTDDVVNTIDTGRRRGEVDVIYRCEHLAGRPDSERLVLSKITAGAVKLMWDRTDRKQFSEAPRRPHSELFEFLGKHSKLWDAAIYIYESAEGNKLAQLITLGYATGLLYLMGSAATDPDSYATVGSEEALDWKLWQKAQDFWADLADNGAATEPLREALLAIPVDIGGGFGRDLRCGTIIKAWNAYSDGKKLVKDKVAIELVENEHGQRVIGEYPRIGGIDTEYDKPKEDKPAPAPTKPEEPVTASLQKTKPGKPAKTLVDGGTAECIRGGKHEWIKDEGGEFCSKCLDPRTAKAK